MSYSYAFAEDGPFEGEFDTREDAIAEGTDENYEEHDVLYTGENIPFVPSVDGLWAIEHVLNDAYDAVEALSDDYLELVTKEQTDILTARLSATFREWAKEFGHEPQFWRVEHVQSYTLLGSAQA